MTKLIADFRHRLGGRERVSALEYVLSAAFLIIALIAVIPGLGSALSDATGRALTSLN